MTLEQNITAILESCFNGFKDELIEACAKRIMEQIERQADTPQMETKGVRYCNECKWFRNKQVCGRCRSRNLFAEADTPQTESYYTDATHFGKAKGESTTTNTADTPQTERSKQ